VALKVINCLRYLAVKQFAGEPDAGNLHVRFYEGGGGNSSPTPPINQFVPSSDAMDQWAVGLRAMFFN
jgi:hypothetical protein